MLRLIFVVFLSLLALVAQNVVAQTGREVMDKVLDRDDGDNVTQNMQMQLIDKNGNKRIRTLRTYSKNIGKETKKLSFFLTPSDVKNTSFLTYDYDSHNKDDDQWLYLPALNKVKRIPSSDKDSSFMGSDFTYSDMTKPNLNNYIYKILKETFIKRKQEKVAVWLISVTPKDNSIIDETGYKKSVIYVRKDNYMVVRAKHFLKKANHFKYMDIKKIQKVNNIDMPIITIMTTKNGKHTIHKTILLNSDIDMSKKLDAAMFSTRSMAKGI